MSLPENLPLADRWKRALAELPIRDRAWFLDCEPELVEGRLLLRFKTALHARSSAERISLLLPLLTTWIPAAGNVEVRLLDSPVLVQPVPKVRPLAAPTVRPPQAPPVSRPVAAPAAPPVTSAPASTPTPPNPPAQASPQGTWRPDLDPAVRSILSKFGGQVVAVSRSNDTLDLPDEF